MRILGEIMVTYLIRVIVSIFFYLGFICQNLGTIFFCSFFMYWKTPLIAKIMSTTQFFILCLNFSLIMFLQYFLKSSIIEFLIQVIIKKLYLNGCYG